MTSYEEIFEDNEYIACVTYCLVSRSGDSVSGEVQTYVEGVDFNECVSNLLQFASRKQPDGQTLHILSWRIGEVYYSSGGHPHEQA